MKYRTQTLTETLNLFIKIIYKKLSPYNDEN